MSSAKSQRQKSKIADQRIVVLNHVGKCSNFGYSSLNRGKISEQNGFLNFQQIVFFENAVTLPSGLNSKIEDQQIVANILKLNHSKYKINL